MRQLFDVIWEMSLKPARIRWEWRTVRRGAIKEAKAAEEATRVEKLMRQLVPLRLDAGEEDHRGCIEQPESYEGGRLEKVGRSGGYGCSLPRCHRHSIIRS